MLLCLSSGHSRRYREDILRAASLPGGTCVQFRYEDKYLAPGIKTLLGNGQIRSQHALIAFCDQADKNYDPMIYPVRFATIADVDQVGTTISLKLRLGDHAYSEQTAAVNAELVQLSGHLTPRRENQAIKGCYFLQLNAEPRALSRTPDGVNWQKLVDQLALCSDFKAYETFTLIRAVRSQENECQEVVADQRGFLQLASGHRYLIKIYQYHPSAQPATTRLELATNNTRVEFLSDSEFILDSRYDHKEAVFYVLPALEFTELTMKVRQKHSSDDTLTVEFGIPIAIGSMRWQACAYALLIALLLAAPHIAAAIVNPNLNRQQSAALGLVASLSSIGAALVAVFKIRRLL